ncbi:hypothetical protein AAVH_07618 [Aphelenchoides avenae]|nr:hypothetical protein AAVH_07618 [Aphelenchus avenae]
MRLSLVLLLVGATAAVVVAQALEVNDTEDDGVRTKRCANGLCGVKPGRPRPPHGTRPCKGKRCGGGHGHGHGGGGHQHGGGGWHGHVGWDWGIAPCSWCTHKPGGAGWWGPPIQAPASICPPGWHWDNNMCSCVAVSL